MGRRSPWAPVQQPVGSSLRHRHLCNHLVGAALASGTSTTVVWCGLRHGHLRNRLLGAAFATSTSAPD
eukprot:11504187-Alexandrium_andersonii.AAC.1